MVFSFHRSLRSALTVSFFVFFSCLVLVCTRHIFSVLKKTEKGTEVNTFEQLEKIQAANQHCQPPSTLHIHNCSSVAGEYMEKCTITEKN